MIKTLKNLRGQEREKFVVPKTVQQAIPINAVYEDGIFTVGKKYSKTFKFTDINYSVASKEDKEAMFLEYSELLNSLDSGATTKITINNRRINKSDFEKTILIPMQEDGLDIYRKEYNQMLIDKVSSGNGIVQEKYVTVSVAKKDIEEARAYFARIGNDLITHFNRLGSVCLELDATDRLRILHDFYRVGEETSFRFELSETMRKGHDFKDFICPDTMEYERDCFRLGDKWGRVLFLREYASYINGFIFGVPGSGKSMTAKREEISILLANPNADVILIDPEREYTPLVNAFGGEVIRISATSNNHINAMDMNEEYGDGANPVILKSEFILSLCEQLIGGQNLGAKQKSIIDRCTANVYKSYIQRGYTGKAPTLQDFREELLRQTEPEAKDIALAIELFTDGSLNTFAKPTNVDVDSRLICYDILDLGKQLQSIGMLVVLDNILNRITANRAKGRNTYIFIDEIYLMFQHEYSANFLFTLWKRVRKYGAFCTGITQNVDDMLQSHTARTMLANSEFIVMLNQASTDRIELAKLLNISDLQMSYITNVDAGCGLIKVGSALVPFQDRMNKASKIYRLCSTKPGETFVEQ